VKQILRVTKAVNVAMRTLSLRYPRGTDIYIGKDDYLDDEGWHIVSGGQDYLVPRDHFNILTVHTKTIKIETLVDEAGQYVETREKVSDD